MRRLILFPLLLVVLTLVSSYSSPDVDSVASNSKKTKRYGIDVSHHNGTINWKKVPKEVQFVYIKATEGYSIKDDKYDENLKGAREQGFKVGAYHYFHMSCSARAQFNNFKSVVKKSKQDLIPMIDVETLDGRKPKALQDSLEVFIRLCKNHYGCTPMIYSPITHYNDWLAPKFNRYHLYIARYHRDGSEGTIAPEITGKGHYSIWQYSEKGKVPGITGNVDLARFHPDYSIANISIR